MTVGAIIKKLTEIIKTQKSFDIEDYRNKIAILNNVPLKKLVWDIKVGNVSLPHSVKLDEIKPPIQDGDLLYFNLKKVKILTIKIKKFK